MYMDQTAYMISDQNVGQTSLLEASPWAKESTDFSDFYLDEMELSPRDHYLLALLLDPNKKDDL